MTVKVLKQVVLLRPAVLEPSAKGLVVVYRNVADLEPSPMHVYRLGWTTFKVRRAKGEDVLPKHAFSISVLVGEPASRVEQTYGTPSYAMVQSYNQFVDFFSSWRQNCRPVLRGNSWCFMSLMPCFSAHALLFARVVSLKFVPSGKISSHMGSLGSLSWPKCRLKRLLSVSHFRERKIKL